MHLFISYARTDRPQAAQLSQDLRMAGHNVWLDTEMLIGRPWWDTILEQIRSSDAFIALVSSSSLNSRACQVERGYAAQLGKPILAVTVEAVNTSMLAPELSPLDAVDYTQPTKSAAYRLIRAVVNIASAPQLPDPLPIPPPPPY